MVTFDRYRWQLQRGQRSNSFVVVGRDLIHPKIQRAQGFFSSPPQIPPSVTSVASVRSFPRSAVARSVDDDDDARWLV
jgi:hypothetical protein